LFDLSGRDGTDSQAEMVSGIRTQVVVAVASSLPAHGRTSAVAVVMVEVIVGMLHTPRVFIGMRQRTVTQVIGPNSCLAMRSLNSMAY